MDIYDKSLITSIAQAIDVPVPLETFVSHSDVSFRLAVMCQGASIYTD